MAEKMPSSVKLGLRPISLRMRSYSCRLSPCATARAGVTLGARAADDRRAGAFVETFCALCLGLALPAAGFRTLVLLLRIGCLCRRAPFRACAIGLRSVITRLWQSD